MKIRWWKKSLVLLAAAAFFAVSAFYSPAQAATFTLSPGNGTVVCDTFTVDIYLAELAGKQVSGIDIYLDYEPQKLEALSISTAGGIFADYPLRAIDSAAGRVAIGAKASVGSPVTSGGKIASVSFRALRTSGTTRLAFEYTAGGTADSNITEAGTATDLLTEPAAVTYTLANESAGGCAVPQPKLWTGWNKISWKSGDSALTAATALSDIDSQCGSGTALAVSRRRHGWLDSFRVGYGGVGFDLSSGKVYYILVSRDCAWDEL